MIDLEEFKNNTEKERQEGRFKINISTLAFSELIVRAITAEKAVELMAGVICEKLNCFECKYRVSKNDNNCVLLHGECKLRIIDYFMAKAREQE